MYILLFACNVILTIKSEKDIPTSLRYSVGASYFVESVY